MLVVAEHADRAALYDAADRAERRQGRPVDVIVRSPAQWHAETAGDPWVAEVRQRPIVTVTREAAQAAGGGSWMSSWQRAAQPSSGCASKAGSSG